MNSIAKLSLTIPVGPGHDEWILASCGALIMLKISTI